MKFVVCLIACSSTLLLVQALQATRFRITQRRVIAPRTSLAMMKSGDETNGVPQYKRSGAGQPSTQPLGQPSVQPSGQPSRQHSRPPTGVLDEVPLYKRLLPSYAILFVALPVRIRVSFTYKVNCIRLCCFSVYTHSLSLAFQR